MGQERAVATRTACPLPVVAALSAFRDAFAPQGEFAPVNADQAAFIGAVYSVGLADARRFRADELTTVAGDGATVNEVLEGAGFSVRVDPAAEAAAAAMMKVGVVWTQPGRQTQLTAANGKTYPAVALREFRQYLAANRAAPVMVLPSVSGDEVCLTVLSEGEDARPLIPFVRTLETRLTPMDNEGEEVVLPAVDLGQQFPIPWLVGLRLANSPFRLTEVVQAVAFHLDEHGARVESGVGVAGAKGITRAVRINRPFLCWVRRRDWNLPVFAAVIGYDVWRRPK